MHRAASRAVSASSHACTHGVSRSPGNGAGPRHAAPGTAPAGFVVREAGSRVTMDLSRWISLAIAIATILVLALRWGRRR